MRLKRLLAARGWQPLSISATPNAIQVAITLADDRPGAQGFTLKLAAILPLIWNQGWSALSFDDAANPPTVRLNKNT